MADTAVHVTTLALNEATADPAGTAIVHANTHVITPTKPTAKIAIRLVHTTASEKAVTVLAGDNPPAHSAGQGNLVVTMAAGNDVPVVKWVVLEAARFLQDNGKIHITVAASTTGFIEAIQLP